jgi:hypothetical protein
MTTNHTTKTNHPQSATALPDWLELVALDDLAESIETWALQMNNSQHQDRALYGTDGSQNYGSG